MYSNRREFNRWLTYGILSGSVLPSLSGCGEDENADGHSSSSITQNTTVSNNSTEMIPPHMSMPLPNLGLKADKTPPILDGGIMGDWWLRGNYGPIDQEIEAVDLEVIGSIPPELNGYFIRNGSNPHTENPSFWFFGDGMLHHIHLQNGKALSYKNRWVQTEAFTAGQSGLMAGRANTSVIYHHQKLLALYEVKVPFSIEPTTLESIGYENYEGGLTKAMCAHPKIDPRNGELWFMSVDIFPAQLNCGAIDAYGQLIKIESIPLSGGTGFMHDFQLTENYVIFMDFPMLLNPAIISGGDAFLWSPEKGARIGVVSRQESLEQIRWFEVEVGYSFHTFNAYESAGKIILEGCRLVPQSSQDFFTASAQPHSWQWSIDLNSGQVSEKAWHEHLVEFPMIDRRMQGMDYRYQYALLITANTDDYPLHPKGVIKYDRQQQTSDIWHLDEAIQPDEAYFVPASEDAGEDEGWLLSVIYNRASMKSELIILDATQVSAGPIARILLPQRVPFGFHGVWINEDDLV